ncbi:hypothetical protein FB451DRAFT_1412823 [Mycena latifolia]|nr:hypothetical protein FB451DRAFT_1412823 [Mycena latifolia]
MGKRGSFKRSSKSRPNQSRHLLTRANINAFLDLSAEQSNGEDEDRTTRASGDESVSSALTVMSDDLDTTSQTSDTPIIVAQTTTKRKNAPADDNLHHKEANPLSKTPAKKRKKANQLIVNDDDIEMEDSVPSLDPDDGMYTKSSSVKASTLGPAIGTRSASRSSGSASSTTPPVKRINLIVPDPSKSAATGTNVVEPAAVDVSVPTTHMTHGASTDIPKTIVFDECAMVPTNAQHSPSPTSTMDTVTPPLSSSLTEPSGLHKTQLSSDTVGNVQSAPPSVSMSNVNQGTGPNPALDFLSQMESALRVLLPGLLRDMAPPAQTISSAEVPSVEAWTDYKATGKTIDMNVVEMKTSVGSDPTRNINVLSEAKTALDSDSQSLPTTTSKNLGDVSAKSNNPKEDASTKKSDKALGKARAVDDDPPSDGSDEDSAFASLFHGPDPPPTTPPTDHLSPPTPRKAGKKTMDDLTMIKPKYNPDAPCGVNNIGLQDNALLKMYINDPSLPDTAMNTTGLRVNFSQWAQDLQGVVPKTLRRALAFRTAGRYINPSHASPSYVCLRTVDRKVTDATHRLFVGVDSAICVSTGMCTYVEVCLLNQDWERWEAFMCVCYNERSIYASITDLALHFGTKISPANDSNVKKMHNKHFGIARYTNSGPSTPIKSEQSSHGTPTKYSEDFALAYDATIPVYDATDCSFDVNTDLETMHEKLQHWPGEIPQGACVIVGYSSNSYYGMAHTIGKKKHVTANLLWIIVCGTIDDSEAASAGAESD